MYFFNRRCFQMQFPYVQCQGKIGGLKYLFPIVLLQGLVASFAVLGLPEVDKKFKVNGLDKQFRLTLLSINQRPSWRRQHRWNSLLIQKFRC